MRVHLHLQYCLASLLLFGCSDKSKSTAGGPGAALSASLEVRAQARGTEDWQPVSPEDVLHSGDRYELSIWNSEPAYVYVARGLSERPPELLLPKDPNAAAKLPARTMTRLPASGAPLELDKNPGEENFYVIAAVEPVAANKLNELFVKAPSGQAGKDRERPPDPTNRTRGKGDGAPPSYLAKPVAPGVLALRFTFSHQE
jgi:hypothetical protein